MEEELGSVSVREQLIAAGIEELNTHGIADFSLRRIAAACNISCAAPYKHFKNKEELIGAIFSHTKRQLDLLLDQVEEVYRNDPQMQLIESCIAYIRFYIANPNFRAVLMLSDKKLPLAEQVEKLVPLCLPTLSPEEQQNRGCMVRSVAYGAALLLESGEIPYQESVIRQIRDNLAMELKHP